jgi:superfamily II DNA or RNA helicase
MLDVRIIRSGNRIKVVPPCPETLTKALTYKRREQEGGDARDAIYREVKLYRIEADGLLAPAGTTARVTELLRKQGYNVIFEDRRPPILPEPKYENVEPMREGQPELLAAVIANDHGIICSPTGTGKSWLIRQLPRLWPEAKFIICSPFSGIIRQTARELQFMFGPNEVGVVGMGRYEPNCRITCSTAQSLLKCRLSDCQVFIFDEVHRAGGKKTLETLCHVDNARMYGFSASPKGRSDNSDLEVEGVFGPIIATIDYEEAQRDGLVVPITVEMHSCEGFNTWEYSTTNARERHLIWRHTERNKLIAGMARQAIQRFGEDVQIMISVSKVEHAVHLGKYLPDFQLVYASMNKADRFRWERDKLIPPRAHPLTPTQRANIDIAFRDGTLKRAIATGVWSTGMDFPKLNVLIRADGQASSIASTQIPGRVTRVAEGKEMGIVMDVDDAHDELLHKRAKRRMTEYRKKGWTIIEVNQPATAGKGTR